MYKHSKSLKRTKLAAAISATVCSIIAGQAGAQTSGPSIMEEMVVSSQRSSLEQALEIKRNSAGVVDAISAEDMGKFPDSNLAESLQRVTGVSIDRVQGEGAEVTVRGFGGLFNLVTLNGRQMPASNIGDAGDLSTPGTSRSFDFANLASEGVSGLQVYKSGRASAPSGGIGATINIQTLRPLDTGTQASFGVKAVDDSGRDDITPELSALGSWTNDDETIGVALFGSYQERLSSGRRGLPLFGSRWYVPWGENGASQYSGANIVNNPDPDDLVIGPRATQLAYSELERKRTNGMLTLEFQPSDRLNIVVDGVYAKNVLDQTEWSDIAWLAQRFDFAVFDGNPIVETPLIEAEPIVADPGNPTETGKDIAMWGVDNDTKDELTSLGINVDYGINDALTLNVDVAMSEAKAGGNGPGGFAERTSGIGAAVTGWQAGFFENPVPESLIAITDGAGPSSTMVNGQLVEFPGANRNGVYELGDLASAKALGELTNQSHEINQFALDLTFDDGGSVVLSGGVGYMESEMKQMRQVHRAELGGDVLTYTGDIAAIAPNTVEPFCITCQFKDTSFRTTEELIADFEAAGGTVPAGASLINLGETTFRVPDVIAFQEAFDGFIANNGVEFSSDPHEQYMQSRDDNTIKEDIWSVYAQAQIDGEFAGKTMQVLAGVRWENTDVVSITNQSVPLVLRATQRGQGTAVFGPEIDLSEKYAYDNLLPSLDVSVDLTDNLKARASMSKTIARPDYGSMFVKTDVGGGTPLLGVQATGSRGTARLDPLKSSNFDLALEYYYGDASAFTITYYDKSITNFVGTEQVVEPLFGLQCIFCGGEGTRSQQAIEELEARGYVPSEQTLFNMVAILDNPDDFPGGADDFIDPSEPGGADQSFQIPAMYDIDPNPEDPLFDFYIEQPTNAANANIDGWEVAWTHFFSGALEGFGFQANMTIVNGDTAYDLTADPNTVEQFALEGLSDSSNLILMYENDRFSGRITYNQRDSFLSNTSGGFFGQRYPRFIDEYSQVDFNLNYAVTDRLTLSLEGINVTNEPLHAYSRVQGDTQFFIEGDSRYLLGMRYAF